MQKEISYFTANLLN